MNNYKKILLQKTGFSTCVKCHKTTHESELSNNSKYGGYNFQEICDSCADKIDEEMDQQQGN